MLSTDPVRGRGLGWPLTPPPDPGPPDCAQTACRSKRGVLGHCCYCASPLLHPIDTGYSPLLWFATRGAMAAAFVRLGGHRAVPVPLTYTVEEAKRAVEDALGIHDGSSFLTVGGRTLEGSATLLAHGVRDGYAVDFLLPLQGGKGGFGTLLRMGGKVAARVSNQDSMRDLSGRRIREVEAEEKVRKWKDEHQQRQAELLQEKERRKEERQREMERELDEARELARKRAEEAIGDLPVKVTEGLRAAQVLDAEARAKRKRTRELEKLAAKRLRMLPEELSDSSDEDGSGSDTESSGAAAGSGEEGGEGARGSSEEGGAGPAAGAAHVSPSEGSPAAGSGDSASFARSGADGAGASSEAGVGETGRPEGSGAAGGADALRGSHEGSAAEEALAKLEDYGTAAELEALGLERLKRELATRGLKSGGTLQQRAERLWLIRGKSLEDVDKKHWAPKAK